MSDKTKLYNGNYVTMSIGEQKLWKVKISTGTLLDKVNGDIRSGLRVLKYAMVHSRRGWRARGISS